jgi:hypothetical protein
MTRLPQIAVVGLFQTGKSLIVNGILGGACLPVGSGLRTTPCAIKCSYGAIDRVESTDKAEARIFTGLPNWLGAHFFATSEVQTKIINACLNRPILRELVLLDTPGFDFDEHDNLAALEAFSTSDAALLVVTQQLPAATAVFDRIVKALRQRPWALVLNCGKSGPHLEDPDSRASRDVESYCVRQLTQAGVSSPVFTQRLSTRSLVKLAQFDPTSAVKFLPIDRWCSDLDAGQTSMEVLRDNLRSLGTAGLRQLLDSIVPKWKRLAVRHLGKFETIQWQIKRCQFAASIRTGRKCTEVNGKFVLQTNGPITELKLHGCRSPKQSLPKWFTQRIESRPWRLDY